MYIRRMKKDDEQFLQELSRKNFPEFEPPDYHDNYFEKFIIESDGELLIGGGMRKIAEVVLVTDISKSDVKLGKALIQILGHCIFKAKENDIDFLYAFCQNPAYEKHLIMHGFERIRGNPLSLWIKHGIKSEG